MERRRIGALAVRVAGSAASTAVLLSAGLGGSGNYWGPQIAALAERYRVIVYDHRGTGASDRSPLAEGYAVADLARDIETILDGLEILQAHIVGHAAGGLAGLALARMAPERVSSLIVVNGWAAADAHFLRCFEIRRAIYEAGGPEAYLKAQPLFLYPAEWISDHLAMLDTEASEHLGDFQDRATLFARMAALQTFRGLDWLGEIRCPTLIVASADDMLVPSRNARILAEGIGPSELAMLPWGGHAVNVSNVDQFNRTLLDFLNRHDT